MRNEASCDIYIEYVSVSEEQKMSIARFLLYISMPFFGKYSSTVAKSTTQQQQQHN
jgi:hypothetical protein